MKFPHFKQLDRMDCGPTCLRIITKYYGKDYSLSYLRERSYISREGVSLLGISEAAECIGLHTIAAKITWQQLRDEVPLPCIVHWKRSHFIVVYNIERKRRLSLISKGKDFEEKVFVSDPAHGLLNYSKDEFLNCWTEDASTGTRSGVVLLLETTPDFYRDKHKGKNNIGTRYVVGYLRPYSKFIFQLIIATLVGTALNLAFPLLTQSIVDYGIANRDISFVTLILIAQVILAVSQAANDFIRNWILLHVTTRVSISLIADFLSKLMKMPISFFDTKVVGDIMQRVDDHGRIQTFLTGSMINIVFSIFTLAIYTIIMAGYHLGILAIFYIGSAFYIAWVMLFLKKRRELDFKRFQQSSANQSSLVQIIHGMHEIKLNNCERQKRWEWERIQSKLFKVNIKGLALSQSQEIGSVLIDQTKNLLMSFLAARAVILGDMTLGMMMAIQYIIGQLNVPIQQFMGFSQDAQDAKISLERLAEIHNPKDEAGSDKIRIEEIPVSAGITIRNLIFRYEGPHSQKALDDINLNIPAGKLTAIVGTSGSGKTTLVKLILGYYDIVEGKIDLDGTPLNSFNPRKWRDVCGIVSQDGYIFSDTILGNITMAENSYNTEKIEKAVEIANIKEFIEKLPLGIKTKIGDDGHGLSRGQKQRILIARAVYKNPQFIFFDEATNALDANNERIIVDKLNTFLKERTSVVIAHRLSTVKNADQIIVLENGKLIEIGKHAELVAAKGGYYNLVRDQIELGE